MKERIWRSALALVMALCLTLSAVGPALAAGTEETINYVSLGDSMTNGYGLTGYDGNTGCEDYGYGSYANLFANWLARDGAKVNHAQLAMSAMRAEDLHWLLELDYTDAGAVALTDGEWDETAWNAEFTTGDYWTWKELCNDYRFAVAAYAIENNGEIGKIREKEAAIVAEYAQKAVSNADVISLGMGNGNFGVFMFGRILEAIGFNGGTPDDAMVYDIDRALAECDPALKAKVLELKDALYDEIEAYLGTSVESNPTLEALANTVVYTSISYVLNYAGSVEAILQLNPDAEIILVALMNTYEDDAEVDGITIGDLLDVVFTPLNAFIAGLPACMQAAGNSVYADATFYYAEADKVQCLVDVYGEDFNDPESTIRDRFVQSIVVGEDGTPGMVWGLLAGVELVENVSLTNITLDEIVAYEAMSYHERAAYAANPGTQSKAVSIAVYLGFEDAILASKEAPVTVESILGLGDLSIERLAPVLDGLKEQMQPTPAPVVGEHTYEEWEAMTAEEQEQFINEEFNGDLAEFFAWLDNAKAESDARNEDIILGGGSVGTTSEGDGDGSSVDISQIIAAAERFDAACTALAGLVNNAISGANVTADDIKQIYHGNPAKDDNLEYLSSALTGQGIDVRSTVDLLCTLLVLPESLSEALQEDAAVSGLLALFARCVIGNGLGGHPSAAGHEALFEAVKNAYENGYTAADKTADNLEAATEAIAAAVAEYYDEAYAYAYAEAKNAGYVDAAVAAIDGVIAELVAIDLSSAEMTAEFKAEVAGEIEEIVEILIAAKALIVEADVLDQAALDALMAMLDEAGEAIENLLAVLDQAGADVSTLVIVPALETAYSKLVEEVIPAIKAELSAAVAAGTQWLMNKIEDAYNAFVEAASEALKTAAEELDAAAKKAVAEAADWSYNWLYSNPDKVIAFFAEYGDDIAAFLGEYAEETAMVLGYLAANYGEEVLEFVMDHADEILKTMTEWYAIHGENTWALIEVYLQELGVTDAVQNAAGTAGALLDQLLGALDQLDPAIGQVLKEMAAEQLDKLAEKLVTLTKEQLESCAGAALPKLEALYNAALELKAAAEKAVEDGIDAAIADLQAALSKVVDALEDAVAVVSEEIAAELNALTEQIKAVLDARYAAATHAEYVVDSDSYYVAIGDGTAVSESYVDALAEELGVEYTNLAQPGMVVEDAYALLQTNTSDIARADLITLGFSANTFVNLVVDQVLAKETPEFDWVTYVGEDGLPYVQDALADVYDYFVEAGVDGTAMGVEDMPALLTSAVEAYAYNCLTYACNLPELINAIRSINEDAVIVVVGIYNPLEDVTINVAGNVFELSEYVDYLVDAASVHAVAYSMITGNAIFVSAPEVDTDLEDSELDLFDLVNEFIGNGGQAMNPSEEGHAYIKEQIMSALDVTALWDISFANMTLSSSLAMNFAFEQGHEADWTGFYAEIVKTYADGRENMVVTIPADQWGTATINGTAHYTITFSGIAAKEMTDDVYVTVYDADGEAQSNIWTDSVRAYATRGLTDGTSGAEELIMMVDMLNYGAAAQQLFNYGTDDLANAQLTEVQKALATKTVSADDNSVKGENYLASNLTLENKIRLNMAFTDVADGMHAKVSFTNHAGRVIEEDVQIVMDGSFGIVRIDQIAVADGRTEVMVTIFNSDGSVHASAVDSMESYIARAGSAEAENAELYEMILKFSDSAYNFFH